jgi:hypothetical protein
MSSERRFYDWPAFVLAGFLAMLGVWAFLSAQHRLGLTSGDVPETQRSGTAEVQSCSRDALYMWVTWTCDAQVRWNGEQVPVAERVTTVRELSGTVDVNEREVPRRRTSTSREVVPADFPGRSDGALFFVMMMGLPVLGAGGGWFAGSRLARLLPEPPEKPRKLTLKSKMSGRRGRDARFNGRSQRRR